MARQLIITLPDDLYDELERQVGHGNVSTFIEDLVRPRAVSTADLDASYREMADDDDRERDALTWIELAPDDALP